MLEDFTCVLATYRVSVQRGSSLCDISLEFLVVPNRNDAKCPITFNEWLTEYIYFNWLVET